MIKQKTAREIYNCYSDIINAEKLLSEIDEYEQKERQADPFDRNDCEKRERLYQLGVPSLSSSSYRCYHLKASMAKAVNSIQEKKMPYNQCLMIH